ncbi:glycosyltransferase [Roseiterribacter gracilis]|uniref:Glycosyltransferase n=1 Tax=Roseiterribacter gracilis TaxID=2812848 RepID=A0A8S8XDV6_9PROT|nr:hypothetical protein TMPK1_38700 [Rhodospirillales bacterium TMPK1]
MEDPAQADALVRLLIDTSATESSLAKRDALITEILHRGMALPPPLPAHFVRACMSAPWPDQWARDSILAALTGDDRWFVDLANQSLRLVEQPDLLRELMFTMSRWLFLQRETPSAAARADIDRTLRRSYRAAADRVVALAGPPAPRRREIKRVAILTPQILDTTHAPTRDALWLAAGLTERGIEPLVINSNCWPSDSALRLFQANVATVNEDLRGDQQLDGLGSRWTQPIAIYTPATRSTEAASAELVALLRDRKFDAVISHDAPFLQDVAAAQLPLLWIATGGAVPRGRADAIWAASELLNEEAIQLAKSSGIRIVLRRELLFTLPEPAQPMARSSIGVADDDVVLVIAGNRLPSEIDSSLVAILTPILLSHPGTVLVLAGHGSEHAAGLFPDVQQQVRGLGHCAELRGLLAISDVMVNPFRIGGGTSAQTAMADGLPIVTLASGDVGAVAGTALSSASTDAFAEKLVLLIENRAAREAESKRSRARIEERFNFDKQVDEIVATLGRLARDEVQAFEVL